MKPIVTIFETINQSGIDQLDKFADITIAYGATRSEQLNLSRKSDVIIVKSVVRVDKELLDNSPSLRIIARAGTGVDNIDNGDPLLQLILMHICTYPLVYGADIWHGSPFRNGFEDKISDIDHSIPVQDMIVDVFGVDIFS